MSDQKIIYKLKQKTIKISFNRDYAPLKSLRLIYVKTLLVSVQRLCTAIYKELYRVNCETEDRSSIYIEINAYLNKKKLFYVLANYKRHRVKIVLTNEK